MKQYSKPTIELIATKAEALLAAESIGVGTPGGKPEDSLVPQANKILEDLEDQEY
ncbi:MAG: hypothetical protein HUK05_08270 [Prevotella sp.]|nr:hypothetical protein [Prevotella sp.]MCF0209180.1 hypothetical protein [Bacteroidaceae bacterium]